MTVPPPPLPPRLAGRGGSNARLRRLLGTLPDGALCGAYARMQTALDAAAKALGMKSRGQVAANRMEYWIAIAFLVVFVCVRNLGYGWSLVGLGGIVWPPGKSDRLDAAVPAFARWTLAGLSLAGFCLNLMWVHKIVSMAMS